MLTQKNNTTNNLNYIQTLIDILTFYDKQNRLIIGSDSNNNKTPLNPSEFLKNHLCEMKIFLSNDQQKVLTIFYDICITRQFLTNICKNHQLPKTRVGIIHVYLLLFYLSPTNLNFILASFVEHFKLSKTQDNIVKFLQRDDLIDIITQCSLELFGNSDIVTQDQNIHVYILKEVKERLYLFKNLHKSLEKLKQIQNISKIKYTIEEGHNILLDYSTENAVKPTKTKKLIPVDKPNNALPEKKLITKKVESINMKKTEKNLKPTVGLTDLTSLNSHRSTISTLIPTIKTTTTQVLRQVARIKKKEQKSEQQIYDLCKGSADPQNIKLLLDQIHESEVEYEMREIERKHLLGRLSLEESRLAKLALKIRNRKNAVELKQHNKELGKQLAEYQAEEKTRIREIVEKNHATFDNIKNVQAKILNEKRKTVKTIQDESRELANLNTQKQEEELMRKINIIKQIKQLEHISKNNSFRTIFKESESALSIRKTCNMSIDELKEALTDLKGKVSNEIASRRDKILKEKERHQKLVQEAQEKIDNHKNEISFKVRKIKNGLKPTPELMQLRKKLERTKKRVAKIANDFIHD